ncbi:MAG TPA: hypothetical protein VNO23_08395 [Candidatus Binatia bacterium]|nr:hypothetical protein [Candidatus Binatia bacterium]
MWSRALLFYRAPDPGGVPLDLGDAHAHSRFQSTQEPGRYAVYLVRETPDVPPLADGGVEAHALVVVREFRRVPLDASGLGLMVFVARPGRAAQVIATLAHWAERAVSLYQPTYLLLARSQEQPGLTALITGVREGRALEWSRPTPFSVDLVLPEVAPFLLAAPERYRYCPEGVAAAVSPDAV